MFCTKCGQPLAEHAKFCTKCGAPVTQPVQAPLQDRRGPEQSHTTGSAAATQVRPEAPPRPAAKPVQPKKKGRSPAVYLGAAAAVVIIVLAIVLGPRMRSSVSLPPPPEGPAGTVEEPDTSTSRDDPGSSGEDPREDPGEDPGGSAVTPPAQDALAELLGYLDQAAGIVEDMEAELDTITNSTQDASESFRKQLPVYENVLAEFTRLQLSAAAIKGLDANVKEAGTAYFDTFRDCTEICIRLASFWKDFLAFYRDYICERPVSPDSLVMSDYSSYYNQLYGWYLSAKDAYSAIDTCPAYLEGMWKEYGEALDLNLNISLKIYQAVTYNDWLRLYSARYMANRYDTVENILREKFFESIYEELDFGTTQEESALDLAAEIYAYGQMDQAERTSYTFRNIYTGNIFSKFDAVDTIYPSLYNTYDAFVVVKMGAIGGTRKVVIEAEIPGLTQKYRQSYTLESSYQTVYIKPPALTGELDLSSAKRGQINVTIYEQDGTTVITTQTLPVTIKSKFDFDWYSDEYGIATQDNILCFLTPEASAITRLKRQAIDAISELTGGKVKSFVGYQETGLNHYATTYLQAAGVMSALYDMGVKYTNDSFALSGSNQHILLPPDVLEQQTGLCIETSLVVASALQSANMHAFLIFPPGHAQVAVEIWNSGQGTGSYFLIETTVLDKDYKDVYASSIRTLDESGSLINFPITYYSADEWRDYLSNEDTYVIDCGDSTVLGLTPFAN